MGYTKLLIFSKTRSIGLFLSNLVDFDSQYGHRRDPRGYGKELERVDHLLQSVIAKISESDLLLITADHGNDPTFCWARPHA